MKKALIKDSIKEIKNTYKRFLSILLMAFLGVGFFAGIKATSPDMVNTIDTFYKNQNVYDIKILSTLGLTNEDLSEISKIENIDEVVGSYETDGKLDIDNKEIIVKTITIENINTPILIEGNLPQNQNECVVEKSFLESNNKQIGDTIDLEIEKTTQDDGEEIDYLKQNKLKIVGTVQSPVYISRDRGTSALGAGKINYFVYISKDNINATNIYTNIYVKVKDSNKYETSSKQYENYIEETKNKIENIKEKQEHARYENLVKTSTTKLNEAETTLNNEKSNAESKIKEAEETLSNSKTKIEKAETEISNNTKKAENEFAKAKQQIKNAKTEIQNKESEINKKEEEANTKINEGENQKKTLEENLTKTNMGLQQTNEQYEQVLLALQNPSLTQTQIDTYNVAKQNLEVQKQKLEVSKTQLEVGIVRNRNIYKRS